MRLVIFMLCQTLFSVALHGTRPIISLHAYHLGVNEVIIGLLVSFFALLPMLFAIKIGVWLDKYGARRLTVLGGIGMVVAFAGPAIYPHIIILFISQLLMGISHLSTLVSLQKTVGNYPGDRDKLIATFSLTGSFGELIGPVLSGFTYQHVGFQFAFIITAVLSVVSIILAMLVKKDNWIQEIPKESQTTTLKNSTIALLKQTNLRKALIVSGLVLYSKDLFVAYFPIYGSQNGLNASTIGLLLSTMAFASIIVRVFQFRLVHSFGRANVLTTTLVLSGIAYLLIPLSANPYLLGLTILILGAGLGLGQPISLVYALNVSPMGRQGEVLGLRLTFNRGSQFVAPFLFGSVGGLFGLSPVFWASGLLLLLGAKFTRLNKGRKYSERTAENE